MPIIVKLEILKLYGKKGKLQTKIPLSNIQSVVVYLLKRLLTLIYHIFIDNLFLLLQLFCLLRQLRYRAIGIACPNCGITAAIKQIKETRKLPDRKPLLYNKVYLILINNKQVGITLPIFPLLICLFFFPLGPLGCLERQLYSALPFNNIQRNPS